MTKKKISVMISFLLLGLSCSACTMPSGNLSQYFDFSSLGIETESNEEPSVAGEGSTLSEEQQTIIELMKKKNTEGLTEEEYRILVDALVVYSPTLVRDVCEEEYQIYQSEWALSRLSEIVVSVEADNDPVKKIADEMIGFLLTKETYTKAIEILESEETFQTLMPALHEGKRRYALKSGEAYTFYLEAGYENGAKVAKLLYIPDDSRAILMSKSEKSFLLYEEESVFYPDALQFKPSEAAGTFTKTLIDLDRETVSVETGAKSGGKLVGAYRAEIAAFDAYHAVLSDVYDKRDWLVYTQFDGTFDEDGKTLVEQPAEDILNAFAKSLNTEGVTVYACSKDGKRALYEGASNDEMQNGKVFASSTVVPDAMMPANVSEQGDTSWIPDSALSVKRSSDIAMKVMNGQALICVNGEWINLGNVSSYVEADPFYVYANSPALSGTLPQAGQEASDDAGMKSVKVGVLEAPKTDPVTVPTVTPTVTKPATTTTKPATTTPAATTTKPATTTTTPAAAPASNPDPAPSNPDPEPSNPDPGPSNPDPGPSNPDPGPSNPDPGPSDPPSGGGEDGGDIGYSPDLL